MRVLGLVTGMLMLVAARVGNDGPSIPTPTPVGSSEGQRLFATKGAELSSAILNGERVPAIINTERGHPVYEVQVIIPPGQSAEVSFHLSEPTVPGAARVPVQPLVENVTPKVLVPTC